MKKLFTLLFLATSMICFGQNKNFLKEVESINFYGVDYSAAKVFGAAETPAQFKVAFDGINRLFITEAKKYDVSKKLKVRVNEISLDAVNQVNEAIDPQELMTTNASYMLSEDQIKQIVNALPTQKKPGIGLGYHCQITEQSRSIRFLSSSILQYGNERNNTRLGNRW